MKPKISPRYKPYLQTVDHLVVASKTAGILQIPAASLTVNFDKKNYSKTAFHYCSDGTWQKIIASKSLWMSDYREMLDPSEGAYCRNKVLSLVLQKLPKPSKYKKVEELYAALQRLIFRDGTEPIFFILSLSRKGNLLTQWREYARENGASLGVPLDAVEAFSNKNSYLDVFDVIYDPEVQFAMISGICDEIVEIITADGGDIDEIELPADTLSRLCYLSLRMKHPAYHSEDEIRVVSDRPVSGRYRRNSPTGRTIQYTILSLETCIDCYQKDQLIFPQIFVAPGPDEWNTIEAVSKELREHNASGAAINASGIPCHWH